MSLWTCLACSARRAVGLLECPQCGAAGHEEGDTISGPGGGQGQRHIPAAYADQAPAPAVVDAAPAAPATAEALQQASYTPGEVPDAVAAEKPPPAAEPAASAP